MPLTAILRKVTRAGVTRQQLSASSTSGWQLLHQMTGSHVESRPRRPSELTPLLRRPGAVHSEFHRIVTRKRVGVGYDYGRTVARASSYLSLQCRTHAAPVLEDRRQRSSTPIAP